MTVESGVDKSLNVELRAVGFKPDVNRNIG